MTGPLGPRVDPLPLLGEPWMAEARCWPGFTEAPIEVQLETCAGCPVTRQCRDFGVRECRNTGRSRHVFGGLLPLQIAMKANEIL